MYATCLHCSAALGDNEAIEALPIGRRLAFDAARGRLWVVCRHCERWNLTPFESRWEAVEQCERAYRATRVRVSTDQIGLARLPEGTELVRIGQPLRPEFAAWRYGDQFGRRRTRNALMVGGTVVGAGLAVTGLFALGATAAGLFPLINIASVLSAVRRMPPHGPRVQMPDGEWVAPLGNPRLIDLPRADGQWGIEVGISARATTRASLDPTNWLEHSQANKNEIGRVQIPGTLATPLLRRVLPIVNRSGATRQRILGGVQLIEEAGGPDHFARWATSKRREWAARSSFGDTGDLTAIPVEARLAFEMALHEDTERRALEGELSVLEAAWREAEEIAGIADNLLLPGAVEAELARMKARTSDNGT